MNKLFFIMHENKREYADIVSRLIALCNQNGFLYAFEPWILQALPQIQNTIDPENADVICAFGGDGTLLRAGSAAIEMKRPLLGINLGRVGFLT